MLYPYIFTCYILLNFVHPLKLQNRFILFFQYLPAPHQCHTVPDHRNYISYQ